MSSKLLKAPKPPKPPKAYSASAVLEKGLETIIGDGSGLASILMSLVPKKKNIEQMIEILTIFAEYLKVNCYDLRSSEKITVYDLFDHEFLKDTGVKLLEEGLLKCISFQEEIKIKKAKTSKKGEAPVVEEEEKEEFIEQGTEEEQLPELRSNIYYKSDPNFLESNIRKRKYEKNFKMMENLQRPEVLKLRKIATKCFFYLLSPLLLPSVAVVYSSLLQKFSLLDYRLLAYLIRLVESSYEELILVKKIKLQDLAHLEANPPTVPVLTSSVKGKDKGQDKEAEALQLLITEETQKIEQKYIDDSINSLQNFVYCMKILTFFMRASKSHYKKIVFKQKKFLFLLCNSLQFHEKLLFPIAQFFSVVIPSLPEWRNLLSSTASMNDLPHDEAGDEEAEVPIQDEKGLQEENIKFLSSILLCITHCSEELHKLLPPPPPPELSSKDKKAAASKKIKDPPPPAPTPPPDLYKDLEATRMPKEIWYTATLHCLHLVLSSLALDPSIRINLFHIDQFSSAFSSYIFNSVYQKITNFEEPCDDLDENISNFFEFGVTLIGKFSEKSEEIRRFFIKKEMIQKLQLLLKDSRAFLSPKIEKTSEDPTIPPQLVERELTDEEKYYVELRITQVRKSLDKSILALLACNSSSSGLSAAYLSPPLPTLETPHPTTSIGLSSYVSSHEDLDIIFSQWTSLMSQEFEMPLRHFSVRQLASLVFASSDEEKVLEKLSSTDSQFFPALCSYIDQSITECLQNPYEIDEATTGEESVPSVPGSHFSGVTLLQGLFFSFHLSRKYLVKKENFSLFVKQERLDLIKQLLLLSGSSPLNPSLQELKVTLYHPRALSWETSLQYTSSNNPYNIFVEFIEKKYLRPVIVDVLSACVNSFDTYLTVGELVTLEPLTQLPEITSDLRNEAYLVISTVSEFIFSTLQMIVSYGFFLNPQSGQRHLSVNYSSSNLIPEELLVSLVQFIEATGKAHCSGLSGVLETISALGFSESIGFSSFFSFYNFLSNNHSGSHASISEVERETVDYLSSPASFKWTRPVFFDQLGFNDASTMPSELSHLAATPLLWPFIILISPIISILSCPLSSPLAINYSLAAIQSITSMKFFTVENQPLIVDIIITLFLSLGGSSSLLDLSGIFGNQMVDKELNLSLILRFFTHGKIREAFWKDNWEAQKAALAQIDPKAKGKKDNKPKEKKLSKADQKALASVVPPLFEVFSVNIENSEEFQDPNHGPTASHWKCLMDLSFDSSISKSKSTNLLVSSILNRQLEISSLLIEQGVDVNFQDQYGRTALMYSLLFELDGLVTSLLEKDALVNLLDASSTPTLFYALCSKSFDVVNEKIFTNERCFGPIYGVSTFLDLLLHHKPSSASQEVLGGGPLDLLLTDSNGYSALFFSLGIGNIEVEIFEKKFSFFNSAYSVESYKTAPLFVRLYNAGANLDSCSKLGVVPLHIVSCMGDYDLVNFILTHEACVNPLDSQQMHPIHYLLSSCPANVEQIFELLLLKGTNREFKQMTYSNERENKTFTQKESLEIDNFFSLFQDVSTPKILTESRNITSTLLTMKSSQETSEVTPIFCAFAGHYFLKNHANFNHLHQRVMISDGQTDPASTLYKDRRSHLVKTIFDKAKETHCTITLVNAQSSNGLNIVHAASLLFQGLTHRIELTPEQARCKRIKYYESIELNIIDIIYTNIQDYSYFSKVTTYFSELLPSTFYLSKGEDNSQDNEGSNVEGIEQNGETQESPLTGWSPLHATIFFGNFDLFQFLISLPTMSMESLLLIHPVHLMASSPYFISDEFISFIISQCLLRQDATSLLVNSSISYTFRDAKGQNHTYLATPLHIAIYNKKYSLLEKLSILPQIDLNKQALFISAPSSEVASEEGDNIHPFSTPIHFAAQQNDAVLIESLLNGKDKMDFTIKSYPFYSSITESSKETCVDCVLRDKLYTILEQLISMRKNDVLLHILSTDSEISNDGNSLLHHLEKENFDLLAALKVPLVFDSSSISTEPEFDEPAQVSQELVFNPNDTQTDVEGSNDETLKETQSLPVLNSSPSALFYYEDEENEEVPTIIVDPYYKLDSSHPFSSLTSEDLQAKLTASNKTLAILLELLQANDFTDPSLHFHSMYSSHQLIFNV